MSHATHEPTRAPVPAAALAQELGTPLTVILARANSIARHEVEGDEVLAAARAIVEEVDRVTRLIRQVIDFSRSPGPDLAQVDLADLIARVMDALEHRAHREGVRLVPPTGPWPASVEVGGLEAALTEILIHAIDAQPEGSILRVHIAKRRDRGGKPVLRIDIDGDGITTRSRSHPLPVGELASSADLGLCVAVGMARQRQGWVEARKTANGRMLSLCLPVT